MAIDRKRYRRARRFLTGLFFRLFVFDILLKRPGLRWLRPEPLPRWQGEARRFRLLALGMGGLMIKLGQFLSSRVDLLPREVTSELAGLQDEVPPESTPDIVARVEEELGGPIDEVLPGFAAEPVGAASLAQVHEATLPSGEPVVVKVLRPGIEVLVETDLAATDLAIRWLKLLKAVRRRVDLDRLAREFRATTLAELDLESEAENLGTFSRLFEDQEDIRAPLVFEETSSRRCLTLENVGFLKIRDHQGLAAAGIAPEQVVRTLYRAYMRQLFVLNFVHSDPHPGNLFVEPLPTEEERREGRTSFAPKEPVPHATGRPFRIVFVDFGMVARIPERLRGALREYLFAMGSRDPVRLVQSYVQAGLLLPGADLGRLEELHRTLFDRFWGVAIGDLRSTAFSEASYFLREYRDLIWELPFQVPVDLLFATRAVGLLAGLVTDLDASFDPWAETLPFAEEVAAEELTKGFRERGLETLRQLGILFRLPESVDALIGQARRGALTVQTRLSPDSKESVDRLERTGRRLAWVLTATGLLLAGSQLLAAGRGGWLGPLLLGFAALSFAWGALRYR